MTKKIYLTRHGQTDFNNQGIVQGSGVDSSLNANGQAQAARFFEAYGHLKFDKVYISNLQRTQQSVQRFLDLGLPYEKLAGLNEISWGSREGKKVDAEGSKYYKDTLNKWSEGQTHLAIDGGESPEDVAKRMQEALDHIMAQENEDLVLINMHGRSMRVMLTLMLNYPLRCMDMFNHSNLGLYELTYTGSMFKIDRHNDTTHLEGLV